MNLRIGHIKDSFECTATESEAELMTHQTLRSVAAYDIFGSDSLCFIVVRFSLSHDAISILRKTEKFRFPQNIALMIAEIFIKKVFGFALLQHQHKWKRAQTLSNVGKFEFAAYFSIDQQTGPAGNCAFRNCLLRYTNLIENLERTCVHSDSF